MLDIIWLVAQVYYALDSLDDVFGNVTLAPFVENIFRELKQAEKTLFFDVRRAVGTMIAAQTLWKELAQESERVKLTEMCLHKLGKSSLLQALSTPLHKHMCKIAQAAYKAIVEEEEEEEAEAVQKEEKPT